MKYITQFGIILTVSFFGEVLYHIIPLPVPASIYGLILMLIGLITGIIPLAKVKETGDFLIRIMPLMFIPATVGLIVHWNNLKDIWIQITVIIIITTILVMAVSGTVTQFVIRHAKKHKK